jgi:hypothetical protein
VTPVEPVAPPVVVSELVFVVDPTLVTSLALLVAVELVPPDAEVELIPRVPASELAVDAAALPPEDASLPSLPSLADPPAHAAMRRSRVEAPTRIIK